MHSGQGKLGHVTAAYSAAQRSRLLSHSALPCSQRPLAARDADKCVTTVACRLYDTSSRHHPHLYV